MEIMQLIQLHSFHHGENDAADSAFLFSADFSEATSDFVMRNMIHNKKYENYAVDSAA